MVRPGNELWSLGKAYDPRWP